MLGSILESPPSSTTARARGGEQTDSVVRHRARLDNTVHAMHPVRDNGFLSWTWETRGTINRQNYDCWLTAPFGNSGEMAASEGMESMRERERPRTNGEERREGTVEEKSERWGREGWREQFTRYRAPFVLCLSFSLFLSFIFSFCIRLPRSSTNHVSFFYSWFLITTWQPSRIPSTGWKQDPH